MRNVSCYDTLLFDLSVLALDCQATGANPARGHLLEIGWTKTSASSTENALTSRAQSHLIRLPTDAAFPRAVQRLTGITPEAQKDAVSPETAWQLLLAAVDCDSSGRRGAEHPLVIHFARFETPFLRELHRRCGISGAFPFQIICTHEIARRLLPELPRRGLRAIAGYYGHDMPEFKRSADHAIATAFVWHNMVPILESNFGILSLKHLVDWLDVTKAQRRRKRAFPMDPDLRQCLPDEPGVYRMSHKGGRILYIGKAKSLKQRVNSYFRSKAPHAEHILEMLTQARGLEITRTASALEAAVLESDEIKRHSPPYNIALRRRQRQIAFCTTDLTRKAAMSDSDYPVGPLPAGSLIEALAALGRCLKDGFASAANGDTDMGSALLALPADYAPEPECLEAGFEIFRRQHQKQLANQSPLRFLTALGARLWQERLEAQAMAKVDCSGPHKQEEANQQPEASEVGPSWSVEDVVAAIEATIRQGAYLVRRARWFCLLSESALTWSHGADSDRNTNRIIFANGSVIERGIVQKSGAQTIPPGFAKPFRMRQNNIDLTTYDRLRVVTTEMRRIIAEGRQIELCLKPGVILGREALSRALQWV